MKISLQKLMLPLLTLTFLNIAILPNLSQNRQQIAQKVNCASPQTTADMTNCADREYRAADKKLNRVISTVTIKIDRKSKAKND